MTPENFCYWLNGLFEISNTDSITDEQVKIIKEHLNLVFNKVTQNGFNPGKYDQISLMTPIDSEFYKKTFCSYTPVSC